MNVVIACCKRNYNADDLETFQKVFHLVIDNKYMSMYDEYINDTQYEEMLSTILKQAFEDYFDRILGLDQACKRKMVSERIRAGLEKAKARGTKLGNPRQDMSDARRKYSEKAAQFRSKAAPIIEELSQKGLSLRAIAQKLNERRISTERGGKWHASSVRRVLLERSTAQERSGTQASDERGLQRRPRTSIALLDPQAGQ
jgi:hypothetical protein